MYIPRVNLPEAFQTNPVDSLKHIYIIDLVKNWSINSRLCIGSNVRSIGEYGDIATETEVCFHLALSVSLLFSTCTSSLTHSPTHSFIHQ